MDCSLPDSSVHGDSPGKSKSWSGLPTPPLGDLLNPGIKPRSSVLHMYYLTAVLFNQGSPFIFNYIVSHKMLFWHIPIWKEQYSPLWLVNSQEKKIFLNNMTI